MKIKKTIVYIVEDDNSFRKSLRRLVETLGFVVFEFDSAASFLAQPQWQRPACLILDFNLPKMDGLALQEKLISRGITMPIIFISGYGNIPISVRAMKKGAIDFLQKPFSVQEISEALNKAAELDVENNHKESMVKRIQSYFDDLTPREQEVLPWVIAGKLSKQIAIELGATEKTVRVHRGRIMKKMHVTSVAQLVRDCQLIDILPRHK